MVRGDRHVRCRRLQPALDMVPGFSTLSAMPEEKMNTHQKALQVNLENRWYGSFAEIGAGQEVVRWFFRVGGAAGTIAKSMSAYDMKVSDAIYGRAERYVSRGRDWKRTPIQPWQSLVER